MDDDVDVDDVSGSETVTCEVGAGVGVASFLTSDEAAA